MPEVLATKLARQAIAGSGELLHRSELASHTLHQNVTSPGGTTAAALEVLMGEPGLRQSDDPPDCGGTEKIEGARAVA